MPAVFTRHLVQAAKLYLDKPEPDKHWRERAACTDYRELFLADYDHKEIAQNRKNEQKTQAICLACPVRAHCLWAALEAREEFFMWGGMNPDQRRAIRRKLRMKEEEVA